jgi:prepilin-type N-terminal cleavage/methylation domain-containing protein/prepilin-type processing-associated H-X9-DG protein
MIRRLGTGAGVSPLIDKGHLMRPSRFLRSRHGFTLVELLVVIAIVALLAALSAATYNSVITKARTIACAGNLRTIGVAMLDFASDNDGVLPESGGVIPYNTVDATTGLNSWMQQIGSYVGGIGQNGLNKVFTCPDSSKSVGGCANYSYFNGGHAAYVEAGGFAAVRLNRIRNPSAYIMAGDVAFPIFSTADMDKDNFIYDAPFNGVTSTDDGHTGNGILPIHGGTVNILFADGHIENVRGFDKLNMTTVYQGPGSQYDFLYPQ